MYQVNVGDAIIWKLTNGLYGKDEICNVGGFEVTGVTEGGMDLQSLAMRWWQARQTGIRGLIASAAGPLFMKVVVDVINVQNKPYAEHAIPPAEQTGTRSIGNVGDLTPTFFALPIKLLVGTRLTRPGYKRIYGIGEADFSGNALTPAVQLLAAAAAAAWGSEATYFEDGPGTASVTLAPVVISRNRNGSFRAMQRVNGFQVGNKPTTQNSRKVR